MLRQTGLDLVTPAALRALEGEIRFLQVIRVSRLPGRSRLNGHPGHIWKKTKMTVVLVVKLTLLTEIARRES